ncbi:MAG: translation elongation factor Ts [Clostridia bacterium]|nr:translation elongation factor Ts [Clostridia bacterium]MBN2882569.1 translation elongation factor Ts [Clostridia bacterium]
MIKATDVKALREKTGAGMMDCKKALVETNGDFDKAVEYLREKGISTAEKKSGRVAAEGIVTSYIHGNGRIGVLLEVNIETDFAAKNEDFQQFAKDVAMQVAAMNPKYVRRDEVPEDVVEKEKAILKAQALNEGKPEKVVEKIIEGRIDKFFKEICLEEQQFIKDTDKTIQGLTTELISRIGENIKIRRFTRYEMGEGLEKRNENFAEEVQKTIG